MMLSYIPNSMADLKKNPLSRLFGKSGSIPEPTHNAGENSLVESIVRQAQAAADQGKVGPIGTENHDVDAIDIAHKKARMAKSVLTTVITLSAITSVVLYTIVNENNYILDLIGQDNLASRLQKEQIIAEQVTAQEKDVAASMALIRLEQSVDQLLVLDGSSADLSFSRSEDVQLAREGDAAAPYLLIGKDGSRTAMTEQQVTDRELASEKARLQFSATVRQVVASLQENRTDIENLGSEVKDKYTALMSTLARVDTLSTGKVSTLSKNSITDAQNIATGLLKTTKDKTLKSLMKDVQDQTATLLARSRDAGSIAVMTEVSETVKTLSAANPGTFDRALTRIRAISMANVSEAEVVTGVNGIAGDIASASIIANNLGRQSMILTLAEQRIRWKDILENVQTVTRLGADGKRDDGAPQSDARRDIDPDGTQIRLTAYEGKTDKNQIEVRGELLGAGNYESRNFALLADVIDALEASPYFKDVSGFSFSKNRSSSGDYLTPISITLTLQKTSEESPRDIITEKVTTPVTTTPTAAAKSATSTTGSTTPTASGTTPATAPSAN